MADTRLARADRLSRVVRLGSRRRGYLGVRCRAARSDRCKVAGSLRRADGRLGIVAGTVRGGKRGKVRVTLTARGSRRLKRARGRLRVRVVATSSSRSGRGAPVRGTVRLLGNRR